jgi:hypothetical protein
MEALNLDSENEVNLRSIRLRDKKKSEIRWMGHTNKTEKQREREKEKEKTKKKRKLEEEEEEEESGKKGGRRR